MSAPLRLGLFVVALAAVFTAAWGLGSATGPVGPAASSSGGEPSAVDHEPIEDH